MWFSVAVAAALAVTPVLKEEVDPITDQRSAFLYFTGKTAGFVIGCEEAGNRKSFRVAIGLGRYVGDATPGLLAGGREVYFRMDDRPAIMERWYAHNRQVSAEADITQPMTFVRSLMGSTSLYVRTYDSSNDAVEVAFTYPTADEAVADVLVRCGFDRAGNKPAKRQ